MPSSSLLPDTTASSSKTKTKVPTTSTVPILPVLRQHDSRDRACSGTKRNSSLKTSWKFGTNTARRKGRWRMTKRSRNNNGRDPSSIEEDEEEEINNSYEGFPLIQSMMASEARRTAALTKEGSKQINYRKSNTGWIRTLFVLEGRALDRILLPWTIVTLNAVAWAIAYDKLGFRDESSPTTPSDTTIRRNYIEGVLELVITTTMAFLLVFRLNRSATRFWMARGCWGVIVVKCRAMVGSILLYGSHDPYHRDEAIRWIAIFSIASMNLTRGNQSIDPNTVEGVLAPNDLYDLNDVEHPPLYAADKIRFHLSRLFGPSDNATVAAVDAAVDAADDVATAATEGNSLNGGDGSRSHSHDNTATTLTTIVLSDFRTKQLIFLEQQLNVMIDEEGALERIRGTPLPLVYVTHLRTWLMLFLLALPYFWESSLGYAIIPVECLAAFALLGLEGAASEVEAPFQKDRTNHLDMNSFCLTILSNILQQAKDDAHRRTNTKLGKKEA